MRHPTAVEALARWFVLTMAGLGLLLVLPADLLGADPVLVIAGQPATKAHLIGLGIMFVAWVVFLVRLLVLGGHCVHDVMCRVVFALFVVLAIGSLAAAAFGTIASLVGSGLPAMLCQWILAYRADHITDRRPARGRLVASGS